MDVITREKSEKERFEMEKRRLLEAKVGLGSIIKDLDFEAPFSGEP